MARWFRIAAIAEAITLARICSSAWPSSTSGAARRPACTSSVRFTASWCSCYFAVTLVAARRLRWGGRTVVYALLASVPPGSTLVFEAWAERTGRMRERQPTAPDRRAVDPFRP